jgi:pimeloyl-ACP methyl ester carboxylesterase
MRLQNLSVLVFAAFVGSVGPAPAAAQTGRTVDVNGHRLYYELSGSGTPTVVIDVGVGESFASWGPVIADLAKSASVLVYDRAGYGRSGPGPLPRDAKAETADLKVLLQRAGVKGPYVLVGHSLGGLNMQAFAHSYPDGVTALVLLDPPPRGWLAGEAFPALKDMFLRVTGDMTKSADAAERSADENERRSATFLRTVASEHQSMFGTTARDVLAITSFGDLSLVVIASEVPNPAFGPEAAAYQTYWIEENRKLSRLSTAGEFVLATKSSHQIHRDNPGLVIAAIKKILAR